MPVLRPLSTVLIVLLSHSFALGSTEQEFIRGDADTSGTVSFADAFTLLDATFSGSPVPCAKALDVDDDGAITLADVSGLLSFLFLGAAPPPPPHVACASDETLDALQCDTFEACVPASGPQPIEFPASVITSLNPPAGSFPGLDIAVADFDDDGVLDVASSYLSLTGGTGGIEILIGAADGSFPSSSLVGVSGVFAADLDAIDVDGDLDMDIVSAGQFGLHVLTNDGTGQFSYSLVTGNVAVQRMEAADLNGDSWIDVVVVASNNVAPPNLQVFIADGSGSFLAPTNITIGPLVRDIAIGDLDGDTFPDLIVSTEDSANVSFLAGDGSGSFASPTLVPSNGTGFEIDLVDIDLDGDLDLVGTEFPGCSINFGDGSGALTPGPFLAAPNDGGSSLGRDWFVVEDLDCNGFLDLLTVDRPGFLLFSATAPAVFEPATFTPLSQITTEVELVDVDGDGLPDLIAVGQGQIEVRLGTPVLPSP